MRKSLIHTDVTDAPEVQLPSGCSIARDQDGNWVVLLSSKYMVSSLQERNEHLIFREHAQGQD